MSLGFVYVLANPSMPGLLKIGQSSKDPTHRASELRTTGVPTPFEVIYFGIFKNYEDLERSVHLRLAESRFRQDREFFSLELEDAVFAIRSCSRFAPIYEELFETSSEKLIEKEAQARKYKLEDHIYMEALEKWESATIITATKYGL